jgi:quinoprotein glucose dehydrogenase
MRLHALLLLPALAAGAAALAQEPPDGTAKAREQMAAFRLPTGMRVELFAAEPQLANPVGISIDEKGRVFVAEEYRLGRGTVENRGNPAFNFGFFLEDDLQVRTLDDRLAMYRKWAHKLPGGMDWFRQRADQVRLLEDTKGTGRADRSTVFAGGFDDTLDGLAAGVLAHNGDVYFTCIPHLWRLRDTDGDGVADVRKKILTGFGVNAAFYGHDLHGLIFGPDGKLYFSIGDRGFHVTSKEGKTFSTPRRGAVFRCDPDGSNFEVVHVGLRNPQGLAFDQYGNLFADDNNCDRGDHARLVYVVEDGDSGWNMAYQTIPDPYTAGPWFAERLWHLPHAGQPAYIVPPVGKIGTGPSGFCFTSGTSLPDRYQNSFLMGNYMGNGGIEAFRVKPQGAGFEVDDYHDFLKPFFPTDVKVGYDGKVYVSDFGPLDWSGKTTVGRIYTVSDPEKLKSPAVQEMKALFTEGFDKRSNQELAKLLGHPDQRVRLRAQWVLANRGEKAVEVFARVATTQKETLPRIHAVWGLAQIGRNRRIPTTALTELASAADAEVRAQATKALGDISNTTDADILALRRNLVSNIPRVQFFAAQSLGRLKHMRAIGDLFRVLKANADRDPFLRHACVTALARIGRADVVARMSDDESASVRLAVVLVLRRLGDERIGQFLADKDALVRAEAARAIHDLPLEDLYPQLAALLPKLGDGPIPDGDPLVRRCVSAAYRLGGEEHAKAVLGAVTNPNFSQAVRAEALAALRDWAAPPPRDRVTGFWRPLPKRDAAVVREVIEDGLSELLTKTSGRLQADAVGVVLKLGVKADEATFVDWAADAKKDPNTRVAALRLLAARKSAKAAPALTAALKDRSPLLRAEARELIAGSDPARGVVLLADVLDDPAAAVAERQRAVAALAGLKGKDAARVLDAWAGRLAAGTVPPNLQLDVLDALRTARTPTRDKLRQFYEAELPSDPVGRRRMTLTGGDAERGRDVFFNHPAAQCVRCHAVGGVGGNNAGPELTRVAAKYPDKPREHFLESMVLPNAKIAEGFGSVTLTLLDGRVVAGTLVSDGSKGVTVKTPDGRTVTVAADDIEKRSASLSAMPSMGGTLTPREIRDVIEYLTTLR